MRGCSAGAARCALSEARVAAPPPSRRRAPTLASRASIVALLALVLLCDGARRGCAASRDREDYYTMLGVSRGADASTIKRAFHKMSLKYHPDRNRGDPNAAERFTKLSHAYEVLSDENKRRMYDMHGEEGVRAGGESHGFHDPFFDFFNDFDMDGARGHGHAHGAAQRKMPTVSVPLYLSLEQLYSGDVVEAAHKRQVICYAWSHCEKACEQCGGSGMIVTTRQLGPGFVQQVRMNCPRCGGKGKIVSGKCEGCPYGQYEPAEKMLLVDVEKGVPNGHKIVFTEEADEVEGFTPGDVEFEVRTLPHAQLRREGDDLRHEMNISLLEALTGVHKHVRQLDGRMISVNKSSVTRPHDTLRIDGEGMPLHPGGGGGSVEGEGAMVVEFWVDFPDELSAQQQQQLLHILGGAAAEGGSPAAAAAAAAANRASQMRADTAHTEL